METKSASINRDFRIARLSLFDRLRAVWEGTRDGRRGLPLLPLTLTVDGAPPAATPGLHRKVQARVEQVSEQHIAWLIEHNSGLVEEIYSRANDVVYHSDVAKDLTMAHKGRLQAAVARADQQIGWYWAAMQRRHIRLRAIATRQEDPPRAEWPPGEATPTRSAIVDLSAWRPAKITLDPRWDKIEELLRLPAPSRDHPHAHHYGTLVRALEILNAQA